MKEVIIVIITALVAMYVAVKVPSIGSMFAKLP